MNTSQIDALLNFDPIAAAEKLSGKNHWSEFNDSDLRLSLCIAMKSNESKRNALREIGDTYWGMTWCEFISLIKKYGFKCALRYDIPYEDKIEEAIIYYNNNGFVIWATSYSNKKFVNGGTLYGQIKIQDNFSRMDIDGSSNGYFADDKLYFSFDAREGLIHHLNKTTAHAEPLSIWEHDTLLWLVDYAENKEVGYNARTITQDKIHRCPKELQDIVRICIK